MRKLRAILRFLQSTAFRKVSILSHRHADVDAYCSAYGVAQLLGRLSKAVKASFSSSDGLTTIAERVYEQFPMSLVDKPSLLDEDLIVIVDTGNAALIEDWLEVLRRAACPKLLIDHHPRSASLVSLVDFSILDQKMTSTSEIVFSLWRKLKLTPSKKVSQALLTGIMADSQHLRLAREDAIYAVGKLCQLGASLQKSRQLLRIHPDRSEILARLKGARRLQIYEAGEWVIAVTRVGSFHASVARSLLDLGADLAFAFATQPGGSRGSFRSTEEFYEESGVHLGIDIAEKISARLPRGSGGGHPTAASVQCAASQSTLFEEVTRVIELTLRQRLKEVS